MKIMPTEQASLKRWRKKKVVCHEGVNLFWGLFTFRFCLIMVLPGLEEMQEQGKGDWAALSPYPLFVNSVYSSSLLRSSSFFFLY